MTVHLENRGSIRGGMEVIKIYLLKPFSMYSEVFKPSGPCKPPVIQNVVEFREMLLPNKVVNSRLNIFLEYLYLDISEVAFYVGMS